MTKHMTGTRKEWLAARLELLEAEKELTRRSDELARRRQELPWVRIDKEYRFRDRRGERLAGEPLPGALAAGGRCRWRGCGCRFGAPWMRVAYAIMSCDGSTPSTEPRGSRAAISAVILPSPQPTSRTRSPPSSVSAARLSSASLCWSRETSRYSAPCHSTMRGLSHPRVTMATGRALLTQRPLASSSNERSPTERSARRSRSAAAIHRWGCLSPSDCERRTAAAGCRRRPRPPIAAADSTGEWSDSRASRAPPPPG